MSALEVEPLTGRTWNSEGGELEGTPGEQEMKCDLMIEALRRELDGIRVSRRAAQLIRATAPQYSCVIRT